MNPVTLNDIALFIQNVINAYDHYVYLAFTLMAASSLLVLCRRLFVGVKQ